MHGILWRWLFSLGIILWVALCIADFHRQTVHRALHLLENLEVNFDPTPTYILPAKRVQTAPALTFWKCLSMIFSISALVYIKRSSKHRKKSLLQSSKKEFDVIRPQYGGFGDPMNTVEKSYKMQITNENIYKQQVQVHNVFHHTPAPTAVGVKIVQKKLEDLECNIASLKERINNNTAAGLVSGSEAFKNFLNANNNLNYITSNLTTTNEESTSNVDITVLNYSFNQSITSSVTKEDSNASKSASTETFVSMPNKVQQIDEYTCTETLKPGKSESSSTSILTTYKSPSFNNLKTSKSVRFSEPSVTNESNSSIINLDELENYVPSKLDGIEEEAGIKSESITSLASTSISSLSSVNTFTLGLSEDKLNMTKTSKTNSSIKSLIPISTRSTLLSNPSQTLNAKNYPHGTDLHSSTDSIALANSRTVHRLAVNYLQNLQNSQTDFGDSQDSGSEYSCNTKSVMKKYRVVKKESGSSSISTNEHILEDKYWLLHW